MRFMRFMRFMGSWVHVVRLLVRGVKQKIAGSYGELPAILFARIRVP
jgi:hypothetical protein